MFQSKFKKTLEPKINVFTIKEDTNGKYFNLDPWIEELNDDLNVLFQCISINI